MSPMDLKMQFLRLHFLFGLIETPSLVNEIKLVGTKSLNWKSVDYQPLLQTKVTWLLQLNETLL